MAKFAYLTVQSYMESGNCESGAALLQEKPHLFSRVFFWDDAVQHVEGIALKAAVAWSRAPVRASWPHSQFQVNCSSVIFLCRLLCTQADANRPL